VAVRGRSVSVLVSGKLLPIPIRNRYQQYRPIPDTGIGLSLDNRLCISPGWTDNSTYRENLEKSGNSKVVREMEKVREKSGNEIRCAFSSSKYSKTRFSAGALPLRALTPMGELTTLPNPLVGCGGDTPSSSPAVTTPTVK